MNRFPALIVLVLAAGAALAQQGQQAPEIATGTAARQAVKTRHFAIAAANPLATQAGYDIIKRGGNAVDAAVAVQLVLNLAEPQSSGIGGGAFILHYDARAGKLAAYDGRETAPAAARPDRFIGPDGKPMQFYGAVVGGKSVGVPGTLRVLEMAHRKHGRLKWAALFEPAIRLAENGFAVSPRLAASIAADKFLTRQEAARRYFHNADGSPLRAGQNLRNPEFAAVLRRVANEGADAFYNGEIARDIVAAVRGAPNNPGDLAETDIAGYQAKQREPVCGDYRVHRVCGFPLPSSGGMSVLQILGMLENFDMSASKPVGGAATLMGVHLFAEAGKLAYADRGLYMADPDFVKAPVAGLLDKVYLAERAALIRYSAAMDGAAKPGVPKAMKTASLGADNALELPSTSHIAVVDRQGNALSMTTTIEDAFGSRLMVRGFLLNNELTDFSFAPEENGRPVANRVEANKRPRSSMAPVIVFDRAGRVQLVAGSPGGSAIINYVAKTLVGVLDWGLDVQQAISLPNFGSRNFGGATELESNTGVAALQGGLRLLGHNVRVTEFTSGLQGIQRSPGGWIGGADPRREGIVLG
ncbi:MAG: gamma-glutamyltransferase, partial [Betaproteobacteria bacterium]